MHNSNQVRAARGGRAEAEDAEEGFVETLFWEHHLRVRPP